MKEKTVKVSSLLEEAGGHTDQFLGAWESQGWSKEEIALFKRFLNAELPTKPFYLNDWTKIILPVKFYRCLILDISEGPGIKRAKYGALQEDIKTLLNFAR
jgi:hypothetical protein